MVSISASRTDSGNDTLVGYRSPGKTIASVGRLTAVWAERVRQRARLHKISAHLKEHDSVDYIPPGYYTDLLELQRFEFVHSLLYKF